jgi:hypothetical protein
LVGVGLELRFGEGIRIQFARSSARAWRTWLTIAPIIGLSFGVRGVTRRAGTVVLIDMTRCADHVSTVGARIGSRNRAG